MFVAQKRPGSLTTIESRRRRRGVEQNDEDAVEGDDEDDLEMIRSTTVDQGKREEVGEGIFAMSKREGEFISVGGSISGSSYNGWYVLDCTCTVG